MKQTVYSREGKKMCVGGPLGSYPSTQYNPRRAVPHLHIKMAAA